METFAVVLTSNFPFGKGEEFFETELPYLRRHFDRIVILARDRDHPQTRPVPEGVELHRFSRVGFKGRLNYFRIPFMGDFRQELQNIRRGGEVKLTVKIVRNLISFMVHGLHMRQILARILEKHGKLKTGEGVVLYAYWMEFPVYAALLLKRRTPGLTVICRSHRCDLYWESQPLRYLPLQKHIADHIDAVYFESELGLDYFMRKNHLTNDGRLKVGRIGAKARDVMAKASSDGIFRILSCSFVHRVKRLDLIVQALAQLEGFSVEWTHIGDGHDMKELKGLASRLLDKRANIKYDFKGYLPNEQVYDYYANNCVDLLVNVSSSEGVPISMMEAFAFGVPVLATAVGGVPEMVNESNGALLPPEVTPEEVARAIAKIRGLSGEEIRALKGSAYETWRKSYDASVNYERFAQDVLAVSALARRRPGLAVAGPDAGRPRPLAPT
jgi:glycosyltransferase involved in cell wall biosynthesis